MQLQVGDWVRSETGMKGKSVLVNRQTAFVDICQGNTSSTVSYLLNQLTKIDPPAEAQNNSPSAH